MAKTQSYYGTGRRKCAIARVWVKPGQGSISINGKPANEYLGRPVLEMPWSEAEREMAPAAALVELAAGRLRASC